MTDLSRRHLLAATLAVPGCVGYQAGAGDARWSSRVRAYRSTGSSYLVGDDRLAIACFEAEVPATGGQFPGAPVRGVLVAGIDPEGTVRWQRVLDGHLTARPAPTAESVVVPLAGGEVAVVDTDEGELIRRTTLGEDVHDAASAPDGTIVATADGQLHAIGRDGRIEWSVPVDDVRAVGMTADHVVAGTAAGATVMDHDGGDAQAVPISSGNGRPFEGADADGRFVALATPGTDATLAVVDATAGAVEWTESVEECRTRPSLGGDLVAIGGSGSVAAYDRRTGESLFTVPEVDVPPTATPEGVYTADQRACKAVAIAPDGSVAWRSPLADACGRGLPAPHPLQRTVVYRSGDTSIDAFRREQGTRRGII